MGKKIHNKKEKMLLLVLGLFLIIGGAYKTYEELTQEHAPGSVDGEMEAVLASDFTVYDKDGNEVQLSDYIGKPIVLNFWASWCTPCQVEMPYFQEKYLEVGENVQFLMVNMTASGGETVDRANAFVENGAYTFPVFYDTEHSAAETYGSSILPTTFFINDEGYIVKQVKGVIDEETLQEGIDMIS